MLRNAELRRAGRSIGWGGGKITRLGGEAEWLGAEKKKQQKRCPAGAMQAAVGRVICGHKSCDGDQEELGALTNTSVLSLARTRPSLATGSDALLEFCWRSDRRSPPRLSARRSPGVGMDDDRTVLPLTASAWSESLRRSGVRWRTAPLLGGDCGAGPLLGSARAGSGWCRVADGIWLSETLRGCGSVDIALSAGDSGRCRPGAI